MNSKHPSSDPSISSYRPSRRHVLAGTSAFAAATAATIGISHTAVADTQPALQATPASLPEGDTMHGVFTIEAQFTGMVPFGLTPRGIRFDFPYAGTVVSGPFEGATVQGTDYLMFRSDGVGVMNARTAVITEAGAASYQATGYILMPEGVELPPDLMLDPNIVWPSVDTMLHGFARFETGAAGLAWLNHTALAFRGSANPGTGTLRATFFALDPIPELTT